jgi:hypothetical protein
MNNRPKIPEAVKRRVRRRCLFGCVVCGIPLFHYDHIEEYAEVLPHTADNITLLCPNHHQMKTSGRLSKDYLLERNANPFNRDHDFTARVSPGVISTGWNAKFLAGGNTYVYRIVPGRVCPCITIDGEDVVSFVVQDGALLYNLKLHDLDGSVALDVECGEVAVSRENWDYRLEERTISIRSAPDTFIAQLEYWQNSIWLRHGYFVGQNGSILLISKTHMLIALPGQRARKKSEFSFNLFVDRGIVVP